jgi:hypothetical protein
MESMDGERNQLAQFGRERERERESNAEFSASPIYSCLSLSLSSSFRQVVKRRRKGALDVTLI